MLGKNYGNWQIDEPPDPWVSLTPNFIVSRPRITLIDGQVLLPGINIIQLNGQIPFNALFLLVTITFSMQASGIVHANSGLGFHTLWNDTDINQIFTSSSMILNETVSVPPGIVLGSQSYTGLCPVINKDHITLLLNAVGGGFSGQGIRVSGYYI